MLTYHHPVARLNIRIAGSQRNLQNGNAGSPPYAGKPANLRA